MNPFSLIVGAAMMLASAANSAPDVHPQPRPDVENPYPPPANKPVLYWLDEMDHHPFTLKCGIVPTADYTYGTNISHWPPAWRACKPGAPVPHEASWQASGIPFVERGDGD